MKDRTWVCQTPCCDDRQVIDGTDSEVAMLKCRKPERHACIRIFSPSEPVIDDRRVRFERGISVLHEKGVQTKIPDVTLVQYHYMAGPPELRAERFRSLVDDPEVDILWSPWGGKSCDQVLPLLDFEAIAAAKKHILAFSDGCVLVNAVFTKSRLITFSGPNVAGKAFETEHADLQILFGVFFGDDLHLLGRNSRSVSRAVIGGRPQGRLVGGDLSTFVLGLVGSQFMPEFADIIFFWGSGGETLQIVDQHLTCLRNAGFFENVRGMVVGDFLRDDPDDYKQWDPFEMLNQAVGAFGLPVLYCRSFGHPPDLENPVLPVGAMCELGAEQMRLSLLEPVVEEY